MNSSPEHEENGQVDESIIISLIARGFDEDAIALCKHLLLEPDRTWCKGEPNYPGSKHTSEDNGFAIDLLEHDGPVDDVHGFIVQALDVLDTMTEKLKPLIERGLLSIDATYWFDGGWNKAFYADALTLKRLAALNVEIRIDYMDNYETQNLINTRN